MAMPGTGPVDVRAQVALGTRHLPLTHTATLKETIFIFIFQSRK